MRNPYMDDEPVDTGPPVDIGPPEDIIPLDDTPVVHVNWTCSGVAVRTLKRMVADPHMMAQGSMPDQSTTDMSGAFMEGQCPSCGTRTIWKKVTL